MASKGDLDWDDLRYFLEAVRNKSLAGAARALGIEHTTIGRRLAALERALGASLVLRSPEGLRLTALGERVVPYAEELERTVHALQEAVQSNSTRVRLAVPSGFASLFVERLSVLRQAHPDVVLEIMSGARLVDLERGEADLALRSAPPEQEDHIVRQLCVAGWSLYAAPSYLAVHPAPTDLDDLGGHDLIAHHPSLARLPSAQWLEARSAGAHVVLRSREMTDMLAAAVGGLGLAVLPCVLGDAEAGLVRLTPEVLARRPLSLVYRREMRLSEPVRAVIEFVCASVREQAARILGAEA